MRGWSMILFSPIIFDLESINFMASRLHSYRWNLSIYHWKIFFHVYYVSSINSLDSFLMTHISLYNLILLNILHLNQVVGHNSPSLSVLRHLTIIRGSPSSQSQLSNTHKLLLEFSEQKNIVTPCNTTQRLWPTHTLSTTSKYQTNCTQLSHEEFKKQHTRHNST